MRLKFQLVFTTIVMLTALLLTWLILADSSPFHNYFLWHSGIPNLWSMTMIVPYIVGAMIEGNPHSPSELIVGLALIIQWAVVGWLLSIPAAKLWLRRRL
jgi:hypothetical protein